jgi:nicotinic acid mononucleotide adenylyltransferase
MKVSFMTIYVYPGSFNPLHIGHLAIAQYVKERYKAETIFEICNCPNDKNPVSEEDLAKRVKQFTMLSRLVTVTNNTSFLEKSTTKAIAKYLSTINTDFPDWKFDCSLFKITFIVGADTINRIDDIKYYCGSVREHVRAMSIFAASGVRFLVFPRHGHLTNNLSPDIMHLCEFVTDFESVNISSTQIREANKTTQQQQVF